MDKDSVIRDLEVRVKLLEERITQLRFSRRVLMNLIERMQRKNDVDLDNLIKENKKLQQSNIKFAQALIHKNKRIVELETKLRHSLTRYIEDNEEYTKESCNK